MARCFKTFHNYSQSDFLLIILIVETLTSGDGDSGRVPRTIDCELTADLTGCCVPGDSVVVCGLVQVSTQEQGEK